MLTSNINIKREPFLFGARLIFEQQALEFNVKRTEDQKKWNG